MLSLYTDLRCSDRCLYESISYSLMAFHSVDIILLISVIFLSLFSAINTERRSLIKMKYEDNGPLGALGSFGFLSPAGLRDIVIQIRWSYYDRVKMKGRIKDETESLKFR
eukprot:207461_1